MAEQAAAIVVTDANIIINLFHIRQLALFGSLPPYRFCVPSEVMAELLDPVQRDAVRVCIEEGHLEEMVVDTMGTLPHFAELRDLMGRGEAACLALAMTRGFYIASDEKRRFRRKAIELIGEARILRTELLLLEAIRRGHISVEDADGFKATLADNNYALPFNSFRDIL